jgi:thiol-disulfide isomerase/thioredoxin
LAQELFLLMDNRTQNTYYGKLVSRYLKLNLNPQIGNKYVDFEQQNLNGEIVEFSEVKGHYTLIEFWASWCGPCRKSYPELKEIYRVYKNRGFEIVGVSIDQNKENWQKAIKGDGLPWVNLTDFMVNDNEAVIIYNVSTVPDNVLIDNQGIIIGRNLENKALAEKLETIFSENP